METQIITVSTLKKLVCQTPWGKRGRKSGEYSVRVPSYYFKNCDNWDITVLIYTEEAPPMLLIVCVRVGVCACVCVWAWLKLVKCDYVIYKCDKKLS